MSFARFNVNNHLCVFTIHIPKIAFNLVGFIVGNDDSGFGGNFHVNFDSDIRTCFSRL